MVRPIHAQLVPELRLPIGADSQAPITVVADLEIDREGRLYVAESIEAVVYLLDASGAVLGRIGRRGEGPGEFRRPLALGWKADTLWVADPSLRRISLFQPDGLFDRSAAASSLNVAAALLDDGSMLALTPQQPNGRRYLLRVLPGGSDTDTIAPLDAGSMTRIPVGPGTIVAQQPFAETDFWSVSSDGGAVYVVRSNVRSNGEHEVQITRFAPTEGGETPNITATSQSLSRTPSSTGSFLISSPASRGPGAAA